MTSFTARPSAPRSAAATHAPPVLLVEDNDDDIEVTLLAFRRVGVTDVAVAHDGVEAMAILRARDALPRVVFLDLNMPRMDGFDVLHALRADPRTTRLPVVVLTSSTQPQDLAAAYKAGANSYVKKSIDATAFDAIAEQLARYWLGVNEVSP